MNASCRPFESSRIQITVSYGQIQSEMCRRAKIFVSGNYYRPSVAFVRILNPWSEQRILKIGLQNSTNSNILATWKPLETDVRDLSLTSKTQTVTLPPQCVAENHVLSIPCGHVPLSDISRERIEKLSVSSHHLFSKLNMYTPFQFEDSLRLKLVSKVARSIDFSSNYRGIFILPLRLG